MAKNLEITLEEIFYFFSASIIVAIILESIWPKIILVYFNLNYLIILWALSAFILLIKHKF